MDTATHLLTPAELLEAADRLDAPADLHDHLRERVTAMTTIKLPRKHAADWLARCDEDGAREVAGTARTITLELDDAALRDLVSDALYYAEEMDRDATGDIDYRPAARTCLAALERAGVTYTRRGFSITLTR